MNKSDFFTVDMCVGYRGRPLIRDIGITLQKGEILTLIGPNGAGKSTTLKAAAGILRPQRGKVTVDGMAVTKENLPKLSGSVMAMVPPAPPPQ